MFPAHGQISAMTLLTFWAERMSFHFEILNFWAFWIPNFQIPRFQDAFDSDGDGRTLRCQLDPSSNAPRNQINRKGHLLRFCRNMCGVWSVRNLFQVTAFCSCLATSSC